MDNKLILYKDDEGQVNVNVRFADEDAVVRNFRTTTADRELSEESTHKKFLLVRQDGKRQVQRE